MFHHHLYYNYTHTIYERTFIHDTCSCIKGRGTHFGVERLQGHIRKESQNYSVPCYAMYGDIRGYFMHIVRIRLLNICMKTLDKMSMHKISKYRQECWKDVVDMEFVSYLTCEIVLLNPINDCIKGFNAINGIKGVSAAAVAVVFNGDKEKYFQKPAAGLENNCNFASVIWCSGPNLKYSTSYVLNIPNFIKDTAFRHTV